MNFQTLILETDNHIATITFNRPKALNAITVEVMEELDQALEQVRKDREIKVLVLTGAGDKAFIAGADISALSRMNALSGKTFSRKGQKVLSKLEGLSCPVIAAVNGYALGGGMETALACDFIYASEKAVFGLPEITLGLIPGFGGTQRLTRIVGEKAAKELVFTGKTISAADALNFGIVNKVTAPEELTGEVRKVAAQIASLGKVALRGAKESLNSACHVDLETGMKLENDAFALCLASSDAKEGTGAFLEKRKPEFTGEME
ncbi:MAG: enoyl-CoA hydratase/isomerase family protein [Thermodesulfobacteriota bacterium]